MLTTYLYILLYKKKNTSNIILWLPTNFKSYYFFFSLLLLFFINNFKLNIIASILIDRIIIINHKIYFILIICGKKFNLVYRRLLSAIDIASRHQISKTMS